MSARRSSGLRFDTVKDQPYRGWGGDQTVIYRGRCAKCRRRVYGYADDPYPDPRGAIRPTNCAARCAEYPALFCWDCVNEHGHEGWKACEEIARKFHLGAEIVADASEVQP